LTEEKEKKMTDKRRLKEEEIENIFDGEFPKDELSKRLLNKIDAQRGIEYVKQNRNFILLSAQYVEETW